MNLKEFTDKITINGKPFKPTPWQQTYINTGSGNRQEGKTTIKVMDAILKARSGVNVAIIFQTINAAMQAKAIAQKLCKENGYNFGHTKTKVVMDFDNGSIEFRSITQRYYEERGRTQVFQIWDMF